MRRPLDGPVRVSGDTAEHAEYGVGPATDYVRPLTALPIGTPVVAPFDVDTFYEWGGLDTVGGHSITATSPDGRFKFVAQHLSEYRSKYPALLREGQTLAYSGNTGTLTNGPHLHCYVMVDGVRMSMEEALREYGGSAAGGGSSKPIPTPRRKGKGMEFFAVERAGKPTYYFTYGVNDVRRIEKAEAIAHNRAAGLTGDATLFDRISVEQAGRILDGVRLSRSKFQDGTADATVAEIDKLLADLGPREAVAVDGSA